LSVKKMKTNNILIAGIGNTIRGDDAIGAYIVSCINRLNLYGVNTMVMQQLHIEILDEFLNFATIIVVDAALINEPISFYPLKKKTVPPASSSHHVNVALLSALAKQLYQKELQIMICAVQGKNFEMGEQLSATAKKNADDAVNIICTWIRNTSV